MQTVFRFDSTIELYCYARDIWVTDVIRFKTEITTQHHFDETYITFWNTPSSSLKPGKKVKIYNVLLQTIKYLWYRRDKNWYHGGLTTFRNDKGKET